MANKRLHPAVSAHYRRMGKKGGRARALKLTPERRSEIARNANLARQKKALDKQAESA